jgi:putative membrane protein
MAGPEPDTEPETSSSPSPAPSPEGRSGVHEWASVYLKGAFMGTADAVPGVSGGTIALVTGIYERLIGAVTALDPAVLGLLPAVTSAEGRRRLRAELAEMDVAFLVVLAGGVFTALLTVSRLLEVALAELRALTFAFFFGLIAASAVVLYGEVSVDTPGRIGAGVAGFVVAAVVSDRAIAGAFPTAPPITFLAGVMAVSAMILPGVSGSLLLLIVGQYDHVVGSLKRFGDGLVAAFAGGSADLIGPATTLSVFSAGALVGLFTVAHVVKRALARYRAAPIQEVLANTPAWTPDRLGTTVGVALVGAVAVVLADRYTSGVGYGPEGRARR